MKLLGKLVAFIQQEEVQKQGALILKDPTYKKIVTHIADFITEVNIGDEIITDRSYTQTFDLDGVTYHLIHIDQILAIKELINDNT